MDVKNSQLNQVLNLLILDDYRAKQAIDLACTASATATMNLKRFMAAHGLTRISRILDVELAMPLSKEILDSLEMDLDTDDEAWVTPEDSMLKYIGEDGIYRNWLTPAVHQKNPMNIPTKPSDMPW